MVELFGRQVFDMFLGLLRAGDINQDVDSAQSLHTFLDQLPAKILVAHIARDRMCLSACILDQRDYFCSIRRLAGQIVQNNVRAFSSESNGRGATDTRVGSGDQGFAACQAAKAPITVLSMIGLWGHLLS
jgi:hypothetical protein